MLDLVVVPGGHKDPASDDSKAEYAVLVECIKVDVEVKSKEAKDIHDGKSGDHLVEARIMHANMAVETEVSTVKDKFDHIIVHNKVAVSVEHTKNVLGDDLNDVHDAVIDVHIAEVGS